jgi:SNF2 family DNA or RNA helicase
LSTFLCHSNKNASWETVQKFDIVLTTYGTLGAEYKRLEQWKRRGYKNLNHDGTVVENRLIFLGENSLWYRVILDEAQCIKNKNTKAALAASQLKALTRFCLTGTPMMNGVHDLFPLIRFLRIEPYNDQRNFRADFGCLSKSSSRASLKIKQNAMEKLQTVIKSMLLRRTKTSKVDGKPILTLPDKTEDIVHAIFNKHEQAYYTALETKSRIQFNKYVKAGTIGKNYSSILLLLLRLRQAACHPHLITDFDEAPPEVSVEDMETWARNLLPDVVRRIIEATIPFQCPICYDPIENPRIMIPCGHDICSECVGNVQEEAIAEDNEEGGVICPTCREKVDIEKVIYYETFKRVYMTQSNNIAADNDETQSEDDCMDLGNNADKYSEDIWKFVVLDNDNDEADHGKGNEKIEHTSMVMLKKEAMGSKEGHRQYMRYLEENWIPSAKLDKCLEILQTTELDVKTIVFSQFTTLLDLLEIPLRQGDWDFTRYDGSMLANARDRSVEKFTDDPSCKVMLISLKAGSVGLNLVAGSQVIILDPYW